MASLAKRVGALLAYLGCALCCCGAWSAPPRPVLFDDFSDGRYQHRTGKDPWGRPLPEWQVKGGKVDASQGRVRFISGDSCEMVLPSAVASGTWKLRYRWPNGAPGNTYMREIGWYFVQSSNGDLVWLNPEDGHWWIDFDHSSLTRRGRIPHAYYIVNMVGSQIPPAVVTGKEWHSVTLIRDADGYLYSYLDGKFVRWSLDRNTDIKDCHHLRLWFTNLKGDHAEYPLEVDDIEVYDGVYLPSDEGIRYDAEANAIVLNGFNITLEKIAMAVNNPPVFAYDAIARTAVCHADLVLKPGARLLIENATLKMACEKPGERSVRFGNDVTVRLKDATLTTTGAAPFALKGEGKDVSTFNGVLWVKDSTLDNFTGLNIRGIDTLHLEDSKFTRLAGSIRFIFTVPTHDLTVRGCVFEGKTSKEAVALVGGDQFGELKPEPVGMDIVDCRFRNVDFRRLACGPYYHCPGIKGGTANAVNCRFDSLGFDGTTLRHKYYLDVLVVGTAGKPVPNAIVTVVNEQDDEKHPAENLLTGQKYLKVADQVSADGEKYFTGQTENWFKGWARVNVMGQTKTGADGHTPLPRDRAGTLVVTSLVQTASSKPLTRSPDNEVSCTYTIRAETADGRKGQVKGVSPDARWYRATVNQYRNTVRIVVE